MTVGTILGRKLGMTQVWSEDDRLLPVTVIEAGPCVVSQVKTEKRDGYQAIQMGFEDLPTKKLTKPIEGHFKKAGISPMRVLREVRVEDSKEFKTGDKVTVDEFAEAKKVNVSGISKGKGFAGVMKRYNFRGGRGSHGSHFHRAPGAVGQCATPSRIFKGLKLPGHMGSEKVTVRNLEVVRVDAEQNLLLVKGAVPGAKGALLTIRQA